MKESLKLLGVTSSDLGGLHEQKSDDDIYEAAKKKDDLKEKVQYLKKYAGKEVSGNTKSKSYLATLVKESEPELACDLIFSICNYTPSDPSHYLLFAEIAYANKAWQVAKSALEVTVWLCREDDNEICDKAKHLLDTVGAKINGKESDNSFNKFWNNKAVEKYWILERLYFQGRVDRAIKFAFKLLQLYPDDQKNFDVVFKLLSLIEDIKQFNEFVKYLSLTKTLDDTLKKFYRGLVFYATDQCDKAKELLNEVAELDPKNTRAKYHLALIYLIQGKLKEFVVVFNKMLPGSESAYVALYFVYCAISDFRLDEIEFPDQKNISSEVAKIIKKLLDKKQEATTDYLIKQFKQLNFNLILPYLNLNLADLFIRENRIELAKELLKSTKDGETHRLWSWIYRLEGKDELAEKELAEFRRDWIPEKDKGFICKPVPLHPPIKIPDKMEDILKSITDLFIETRKITAEFDMEYGLNTMTCIETGCQDCCKKTFPYMSYIEYLYLLDILKNESDEFKKQIYDSSKKIVSKYKNMYKKDPPLVLGGREEAQKEYPSEFRFDCPCLGDNKCNAYHGRPFTCRAYGFGSADGTRYKGCSCFFEQFKGATKLNSIRRVVDMNSFINYACSVDEKLIGKHVIAPIPVWFAYSYEENMERIKNL